MSEIDDDESASDEDNGRHKSPADIYKGAGASPLPPIGPDGAPILAMIAPPVAIPAADPVTFICLRGPCRHYWELSMFLPSGNPEGTFGEGGLVDPISNTPLEQPDQILRTCTVQTGTETDLTDELVKKCNLWDPLSPRELKKLEKRRSRLLKIYGQ
jgi:hypothetical protein